MLTVRELLPLDDLCKLDWKLSWLGRCIFGFCGCRIGS